MRVMKEKIAQQFEAIENMKKSVVGQMDHFQEKFDNFVMETQYGDSSYRSNYASVINRQFAHFNQNVRNTVQDQKETPATERAHERISTLLKECNTIQ